MPARRFVTTLIEDDDTSACGIRLPFDPRAEFGRVRAPVKVTINNFSFRTTTCSMGGAYWIVVNKANRAGAGIAAGNRIAVTMELDTEPRVVQPPHDFLNALRASDIASAAWQKLSYTHQREHVEAILQARKPETRQRRIAKAIEMLERTRKEP